MSEATAYSHHDDSIVGRDRERSGLGALLDQARNGNGCIVLVSGQAGIGKTSLARDMARRATDREMLALTGHCYDLSVTPPYGPWAQIVRGATRVVGLPDPPAALVSEEALRQSTSQQALFQELEDFLAAIAERQPLALILEDLHWADPASLEFLRSLGHQMSPWRVLVMVTYRDDELTRRHPLYDLLPALVRESPSHRIHLRPLDDRAVRELIAHRYSLDASDGERLCAYLRERAEGNPFFVGEALRTLEEEERLRLTDDGWVVGDLEHVGVPPLVRQVIDGRLNRLGRDARAMLEVASVIGQDVPFEVWAAASQEPGEALAMVAEHAVEAHVLEDAREGDRLRFTHALVREALYEGVLPPRRRALHLRVAEALMSSFGVAPDTIAYHLREAGDSRAVEWFVQAGVRAERAAWLTAAEHFTAALALMREYDIDPVQRGWLIVRLVRLLRFSDTDRCFRLLDEAAEYMHATGDAALAAYVDFCRAEVSGYTGKTRVHFAMTDQGIAVNALRHLSPADQQRLDELVERGIVVSDARLIATQAAGLSQYGRTAEAIELAHEVMNRSRIPPAEAPWALAVARTLTGEVIEARQAYRQARELFIALDDYSMAGSTALYELVLALMAYLTDDLDARKAIAAEGEAVWNRARGAQGNNPGLIHLPNLVVAGSWREAMGMLVSARSRQMTWNRRSFFSLTLAHVALARGDVSLAWTLVQEALPTDANKRPTQIVHVFELLAHQMAAAISFRTGDLEGARDWLESMEHWLTMSRAVFGRADTQLLWAQWRRASGDHEAARQTARQALETASTPRQPLALLRAHRLLGELATSAGDLPEAESCLRESLRLAEACAAPYERALTLIALAEQQLAAGQPAEAASLLDDARETCERLEARPALERISALALRLIATAAGSEYPAGLSAREVEVLRLAAQGLTNVQIGEQLFLSPRTVEHHLRSVYQKLDVSSRAAATRFAVEHDLI
ncbi:MAG TPA: AAA family ATPase [Thermomicrobiales bacterium]|nr:AAA family ATPase [Thermomicrobiales bacterium]